MSFGPPVDHPDAAPSPDPDMAAAASLYHQAFTDGQASVTRGGYQAGRDLGHDVGYGARNDHARPFVAGVVEGHATGVESRRELVGELINQGRQPDAGQARARMEARGEPGGQLPLPEPQAEKEAEAG